MYITDVYRTGFIAKVSLNLVVKFVKYLLKLFGIWITNRKN
jgi:hypothetical protein